MVTIERYLASQVGMTPLVNQMRGNVISWFYSSFVQRTGMHLIELNSGRLRVGADRWRELQEKSTQTTTPDGARPRITKDLPELTIALIGQVKAGKSSLVNALLGQEKAEVDVLPATDAITRYRFAPTDVAVRFTVLDTIGYAGGSDPKQALAKALKAVNQAQVVLVVLDAQMAARAADHAFLEEWQNWFEKHPESRPPPLLGVMTHIDLLSPSLEWQPPYAGWLQESPKRPKEQMIREAVLSVKETLQPPLAGIVPVCTAAGKIYGIREFLWPALIELLPEAHARRINEALLSEGTADRWRQLWSQVVTSAGQLAQAGLAICITHSQSQPTSAEDEESPVMRRTARSYRRSSSPRSRLASTPSPDPGRAFNGRARQVNFERIANAVRLEYKEDENSLKHQAGPIAASLGIVAGAASGTIPVSAAAADLAGKLWGERMSDALDEYMRQLAEEKPELLEPAKEERGEIATVRDLHRLMHERIGRMPPAILERYRRRVDAEAQQLLRDAESTRSQAPLRRLVRDYFASGPTEKALAILGDDAFERGRFDEAIAWWTLLAPLPGRRDPKALVYPAGTLDRDRIVAKEILALIFEDRFAEAERELAHYEKTSAAARGSFAGEEGPYAVTLRHWLDRRRAESKLDEADPSWPTFAGATTGNRVFGKPPSDRLWIDGPTWKAPLAVDRAPTVVRLSAGRAMSIPATPIHPIIVDGQVVYADGDMIESRDLATGAVRFRRGLDGFLAKKDPSDETHGVALSAGNGVVCVRLGPSGRGSWLMALDLAKAGDLRWKVAGPEGERSGFASDPLVLGDRVVIVKKTVEDRQTTLVLDCLDLATGAAVWSTKLADFETPFGAPTRAPLVLADDTTLVVISHAGFVVACDRLTGSRTWAIRYPSAEIPGSPRDVAAGLIADGRLYVAPADASMLFAADLATGRVLWDRPWLQVPTDVTADPATVAEVVQLYGVVDGRLLFTDRGRLVALDAADGTTLWQQPSLGKLPGQGRGLIAGSWVFWPTADTEVSWRAVTHETGELRSLEASPEYFEPTTLRNIPAGNVVWGEGCLVIAGSKELVVFVPPEMRIEKLKQDAKESKVQPATLGLLAMAQRSTGQTREAEATLAELWSRVPFYEKPDWEKLFDQRQLDAPPKRVAWLVRAGSKPTCGSDRDDLPPPWPEVG